LPLALFASHYIIHYHLYLEEQYGSLEGYTQYFVAIILLITVLETARRAIKLALPITALLALVYGLFGHHIPGKFGHQEIPLDSFIVHL